MHQHRYIRIRNRRIVRRSRRTEYKDRILRMRIALFKRRAKAQFECIAEFASAREERRREIEGYATRMVQFQVRIVCRLTWVCMAIAKSCSGRRKRRKRRQG
ncbi:hypothetical protein K474DRAFT_100520 [Panus rudis PR-1116 ss-1]|nr:hypothetical protein K474DRAFT_100520 [Panus rudis PR-1116 ss-1]